MVFRLAVCLFFIAVISVGCRSTSDTLVASATPAPIPAPNFTLTTLNDTNITLAELRGKWVIVNFWASWCIPCATEMPVLQQISQEFADAVVVLGVNHREDRDTIATFVQDLGLTFPILINANSSTFAQYQVNNLPQTVIINPQGDIIWRHFGPLVLTTFRQQLTDWLQA